ncbi:uncharacterized protein LOC128591385 [Nycticebus coucang]|uniref:uncharacterized protein LOC128591385 n=1 Tax=Nycticebus coucang TaxID=9470 RepID=UPI00234C8A7F|nr:uncharacterized protein LOC128591385 [Nycticebus coucang]
MSVWAQKVSLGDREEPHPQPHIQREVHAVATAEKQEMVQEELSSMWDMSRSQFGQGKKPLDTFFWANEITGEITYPPLKAGAPAASPERPGEWSGSQCEGARGAPPSPQGLAAASAHRSAPLLSPEASAEDKDLRSTLPPTVTQVKAGVLRPLRLSEIPVTISPPGQTLSALGALGALGPIPQPQASTFSVSSSAPWAFTYKLKNVLTGNNRFSF